MPPQAGIVGLLLLSAVNTAVGALIGLNYMMARDGEMPWAFRRLNNHGVPWYPMAIAVVLPLVAGTRRRRVRRSRTDSRKLPRSRRWRRRSPSRSSPCIRLVSNLFSDSQTPPAERVA